MAVVFKRGKVAVMVATMARSIKFYTKTLGLKLLANYGEWAEIKGPGITIGLYPAKRSGRKEESVSIGFEVKDLDKAAKALAKKGVKFQFFDEDYMRFAYFSDPDGTELYLAEKKK